MSSSLYYLCFLTNLIVLVARADRLGDFSNRIRDTPAPMRTLKNLESIYAETRLKDVSERAAKSDEILAAVIAQGDADPFREPLIGPEGKKSRVKRAESKPKKRGGGNAISGSSSAPSNEERKLFIDVENVPDELSFPGSPKSQSGKVKGKR